MKRGEHELDQMREERERLFSNYTMIRNGIKDHIEAGHFGPASFGIYTFLHLYAQWDCAIIWTNAQAVTTTFSCGANLRQTQEAFKNLRKYEYISYPEGGFGKGQIYPVALIKGEPTQGVLRGSQLIGFTDNTLETVEYEFPCASRAQAVLKPWVGLYIDRVHDVRCPCASCAQAVHVGVSLQDLRLKRQLRPIRLERLQDEKVEVQPPTIERGKEKAQAQGVK